jgi:DNA-binding MarR family transcriptional regulator
MGIMDLSKINLDPIFHSRVRLAIISILNNYESCSFTDIVSLIKATAGNVSVQIKKLQEAGYIEVQKKIRNNYPYTICKITEAGTNAFEKYTEAIQKLIDFGKLNYPVEKNNPECR